MNLNIFSPEGLLWIASALLAVLCDWFPAAKERYDRLTPGQKRFWMALFVVLAAVLIFSGTCLDLLSFNTACSVNGAKTLVIPLLFAIAVNQGVQAGTKPTK
jgi:hypothetical protein